MRKAVLCLALVGLVSLGGSAFAEICAVDNVPASTLLVPYFEVDFENDAGITTLFSINNASAAPVLTHVVLWTDLSRPTLDFPVYLTGYDVQTINLRDIFNNVFPVTGPNVLPAGAFSLPNVNFPGCQLPIGPAADSVIQWARQAHTGQNAPLFGGGCYGVDHGDNIARGYVTVDVVNSCSQNYPSDPVYQSTILDFQNVIWGDWFLVDPTNNFAQGNPTVSVESAPQGAFVPGDYTFYGRYNGWTAIDRREPLSTTFATRYVDGGPFTGGTDLICWRDAQNTGTGFFTCGTIPSPFLLGQDQVVDFDEEENPFIPEGGQVPSPLPPTIEFALCPWEATRTSLGDDFPVVNTFGWVYLNLNTLIAGGYPGGPYTQNWVGTVMSASGLFSVGYDATVLNSACAPSSVVLPVN